MHGDKSSIGGPNWQCRQIKLSVPIAFRPIYIYRHISVVKTLNDGTDMKAFAVRNAWSTSTSVGQNAMI